MAKDAEKNKPEEQAAEGGKEKKKGSKLKWIIVAVVALLVLGGGGAGAYFFMSKSANKEAQAPAKPPIGAVWAPDVFIINLADAAAWVDRVDALIVELHDRKRPGCTAAFEAVAPHFGGRWSRGENEYLLRPGAAVVGPAPLPARPLRTGRA